MKELLAKLKGWRTLGINAVFIAAGMFAFADQSSSSIVSAFVSDPKRAAAVIAGISLTNVFLRLITTTPWGTR